MRSPLSGDLGHGPAVEEQPEDPLVGVVPVGAGHLATVAAEPPRIGKLARHALAGQEPPAPEHRVLLAHGDQPLGEGEQVALLVVEVPVLPGDLVVLAPRVVVAALGPSHLVAARGSSGTPWDSRSVVSRLRCWRARSSRISGSSVGPSAPQFHDRLSSVPSRLSSRFASLCLSLYETRSASVKPSCAVTKLMDADGAPSVAVQVARAGQPLGEVRGRGVPAPEVADHVAVDAVPLGPEDREVADLVAAGADVPGLGDELHLRQHGILVDDVEERGQPVDVVELAGQCRARGRSGTRRRGTRSPSSAASP